jgi:DGQHR domain-containing protein
MEVKMPKEKVLRIPAIEVNQSPGRRLYTFAIDGKLIPTFTTISRVRRQDGGKLEGYQRPEVLSHIAEIRNYLESSSPMIPNAIVVAFDSRVRFEPSGQGLNIAYSRSGELVIPIDPELPEEKQPGFIVDGQQRLAAIREAKIDSYPICVTAFITNDLKEQAEQFILVNSTTPLPTGLIYELLPNTEAKLPSLLQRRRFPSYLLDRLNRDDGSPLRLKVQTPTCPQGIIKDNSILKMLENSLSDGILYRFRDFKNGEEDVEGMLQVLKSYWGSVGDVFSDAWGLPPRRSRLMHGAGIVSLGFVMDAIADRHRDAGVPKATEFSKDLKPLKDVCRWTDGYWDFGPGCQRKWNEIQNTTKDIQLLSNYLLVQYKSLVWSQRVGTTA